MTVRVAVWILLTGLPLAAAAASWYEPTLEDHARGSDRIARARILGVKEVVSGTRGLPKVCGYGYRVKVLDALKGSDGDFEFFSHVRVSSEAAEHLVLAFELREEQRAAFRARAAQLTGGQRRAALCALDAGLRYHEYALMEFDSAASESLSGEWVRPLEPVTAVAELDRSRVAQPAYEVLRWELLRTVILNSLTPGD